MTQNLSLPTSLPVVFLHDTVVLPGMVVPIELDDSARAAIDAARLAHDAAQDSEPTRVLVAPRLEDRYATHGVVAVVDKVGRFAGGKPAAVLRAERRVAIGAGVSGPGAALWVEAEAVPATPVTDELHALAEDYRALVVSILERREAWQVIETVRQVGDPDVLADMSGYAPYLSDDQKRQVLETPDVGDRLRLLVEWTRAYDAEDEVNDKISQDVREGLEKNQREFLLRQQLAAIRKELGEGEPDGSDDYRARVEAADLPEAVREAALREVDKLERSSEQNPEAGWIRTWLDTVLELPWSVRTEDSHDVAAARAVLDADHHGLDEVKDRITEYLAVRARRAERGLEVVGGRGSGAVILLAGPPGVGKTSLGESVARTLGRRFVRVALGGVRDEAEIRGHRRTYVGALPGRIVRAVKEAGSMNPVRPARRGRQGRRGLPRRPGRGAARGARPGAEPHVPRPLPRARPRPVRRALHRDRQRGRADPVGAAGPDGARHHRRLHRGRQGRHRPRLPHSPAARAGRADGRRGHRLRRRARRDRRQLHPRGRRTTARAAAGQGLPQGRDPPRDGSGRSRRHRPGRPGRPGRAAALHARQPRAHRRARRRHRPGRHRPRRRRALRRDVRGRGHGGAHRHRPARRGDEGVGLDRPLVGPRARGGARDRAGRVRAVDPRALPGGRGPEGRSVRGRHDGDRAGVAADRPARALGRRHDRRGVPRGPGAADRRAQAEAAGRPARRAHDGVRPGAQPPRPRRRTGRAAR